MTAAEELNAILGNKPSKIAKVSKSGKGRRGQQQARGRVYKTERENEQVQEQIPAQEQIQQPQPEKDDEMTNGVIMATGEKTVAVVPVEDAGKAIPDAPGVYEVRLEGGKAVFTDKTPVAEAPAPAPETKEDNAVEALAQVAATMYTFPPLEQCFSSVVREVKWADLAFAAGDALFSNRLNVLPSTFPSLGRMLDKERDADLRCYNLSDFLRFLGKSVVGAEASHRAGFTRLNFGFATAPFEMSVIEVNDDFEINIRFKPESAIGRVCLLKMEHCEVLTSKDIDRALLILDAAIKTFNTEMILQPAIQDLIKKEVKEMV